MLSGVFGLMVALRTSGIACTACTEAGEAFIGTFWHTPLRVQGKRFPNCDQTVERPAACAKMSPISATIKKTSCLPTGIPEAAACNSSRGPLAALRSTKVIGDKV